MNPSLRWFIAIVSDATFYCLFSSRLSALTRLLTPKRPVDILRGIQAARAEGRPFSIVFVGVNGVGKSTSLAKVCYWLRARKFNVSTCQLILPTSLSLQILPCLFGVPSRPFSSALPHLAAQNSPSSCFHVRSSATLSAVRVLCCVCLFFFLPFLRIYQPN